MIPFASVKTPHTLLCGTRIPRDTLFTLQDSSALLRAAQAEAHALREQTISEAAQSLQAARVQGFAQGRLDAMALEQRLRALISHRLANIVLHCIRSVLGEIGESALLRQRILHLLGRSADAALGTPLEGATLTVCPAQLPSVQAMLGALGASLGGLRVVADPECASDVLRLETPRGFAQSELELTLQQTHDLVQSAVALALQTLGEAA
jgi:flagellar biosynthesis/type III secretory pathway protein FliH